MRGKEASSIFIKTNDRLLTQTVSEISSQRPAIQKRHPEIKTTEGRPRQYYWTSKTDLAEVIEAETTPSTPRYAGSQLLESDLYPILSQYLWSELRVYSKRINETRSSNRLGPNGNKWLYPDVVGMEDLTADWHPEIREVVRQYADKKTRLWSFEVKRLINRSNVREVFFQAVSNSSWANFGYLVAAEIEGALTMKELRMLLGRHGIGVIHLNATDPADSQIVIPARERQEVDWATCDRLTNENTDFLHVMKLVRQFYQIGDARPRDWDLSQAI